MTVAFFFLLFLLVGTAVPAFKTLLEGNLYLALFWYGSMAALLLFVLPRVGVRRRAAQRRGMRIYALTGAAIFLALRFVSAVFMKCLKGSPYDSSIGGMVRNVLLLLLPLIVREGVRAYGLGLSGKHIRHRTLSAVLLTLFLPSWNSMYSGHSGWKARRIASCLRRKPCFPRLHGAPCKQDSC